MLLVSSKYPRQKVIIDDSCAHCVQRIGIAIDSGYLVDVEPPETYVFYGGG